MLWSPTLERCIDSPMNHQETWNECDKYGHEQFWGRNPLYASCDCLFCGPTQGRSGPVRHDPRGKRWLAAWATAGNGNVALRRNNGTTYIDNKLEDWRWRQTLDLIEWAAAEPQHSTTFFRDGFFILFLDQRGLFRANYITMRQHKKRLKTRRTCRHWASIETVRPCCCRRHPLLHWLWEGRQVLDLR